MANIIDLNVVIHDLNLRYWREHPDIPAIKYLFRQLLFGMTLPNTKITPNILDDELTYFKNKSPIHIFEELLNNTSVNDLMIIKIIEIRRRIDLFIVLNNYNVRIDPNQLYSDDYDRKRNIFYCILYNVIVLGNGGIEILESITDNYIINPNVFITTEHATILNILLKLINDKSYNRDLHDRLLLLKDKIIRKYNINKSI